MAPPIFVPGPACIPPRGRLLRRAVAVMAVNVVHFQAAMAKHSAVHLEAMLNYFVSTVHSAASKVFASPGIEPTFFFVFASVVQDKKNHKTLFFFEFQLDGQWCQKAFFFLELTSFCRDFAF